MSFCREIMVDMLLEDPRIDIDKINDDADSSILHAAILQVGMCGRDDYYKYINIILRLLKAPKIDVNKANKYGQTPLHYACLMGNSAVLKIFLDHGSNVNAINSDGKIPIDTTNHFPQCAQILQDAGSKESMKYNIY